MKKPKLRAPFVVTLSMVACSREPAKPLDRPVMNPPPTTATATATETAPATEPAATTATGSANERADWRDYPRELNPQHPDGVPIRRAWGDKVACYVEQPWPKGEPRMPGQMKTKDVPCPDAMKTAAWAACPGGVIAAAKDPAARDCACFQMGNPPPLPHKLPCP